MSELLDALLDAPLYGVPQSEKEVRVNAALTTLSALHRERCPAYRRIADVLGHTHAPARLADQPWLPVGLFKTHRMASVSDEEISTILTSSGTTGQLPSRIYLDKETARRQTRALVRIMTHVLGPRRLPMLVIDTKDVLQNRSAFSARGAGVLGMLNFGAAPTYALDPDMNLDRHAVDEFLAKHGRAPFLIFGFTYMVWAYFFAQIEDLAIDLQHGTLIHSGGWKKLSELAVDNTSFKARLRAATGLSRVFNFYGMVEQVGSIFLEGPDGLFYPPVFGDVIVRDPDTLQEVPPGHVGILHVMSVLPTSYPGHSLLTEDLGVVEQVDRGERLGKGFRILGRVPRSELRGCSDTHAAEVAR